jgi:hypothetical protein
VFEEICAELSQGEKDILAEELSEPIESQPPRYRADVAKELGRLCIADDELVAGIDARVEQFVATHTPAQVEEQYQREWSAYNERQANHDNGGEDE